MDDNYEKKYDMMTERVKLIKLISSVLVKISDAFLEAHSCKQATRSTFIFDTLTQVIDNFYSITAMKLTSDNHEKWKKKIKKDFEQFI